jgi:glucan biosynthesis protein
MDIFSHIVSRGSRPSRPPCPSSVHPSVAKEPDAVRNASVKRNHPHTNPLCNLTLKPGRFAKALLTPRLKFIVVNSGPKMTEKQFKPGQRIQMKSSGGRIEEAKVKAVIEHTDGIRVQVDFGYDQMALIELWQVVKD